MSKIPYRIPEYHKMVWGEAWKETIKYHLNDLRNIVGNIIVAILSGVVYAFWSYIRLGTMIDWLGVIVSVIAGFVGWSILLFVGNGIWKVPAKLYRARETEAWLFTWNDLEVKPFVFPEGHRLENRVGIEIISHKDMIVYDHVTREYDIQVQNVLIEEFGTGMHTENPRKELHLLLCDRAGFSPITSILNLRQLCDNKQQVRHVVALIAQWDDSQAWIVTKDGERNLLLEINKMYSVIIDFRKWSIELSNPPFEYACAVWCNLRYVKNKEGLMVVEIEISRRNPEYAYEKKNKKHPR